MRSQIDGFYDDFLGFWQDVSGDSYLACMLTQKGEKIFEEGLTVYLIFLFKDLWHDSSNPTIFSSTANINIGMSDVVGSKMEQTFWGLEQKKVVESNFLEGAFRGIQTRKVNAVSFWLSEFQERVKGVGEKCQ